MQIHTYVDARLSRWAAWYHSGTKPGPKRISSWWGPMILNRSVAQGNGGVARISFDPTECEETDRAVRHLGAELHAVIVEYWLKGGTVEQKCRALHCCKQTLYNRIERAKAELLGHMNDQAAGVELYLVRAELKFG